jgi:APA family basic amino acid/polyamine antiporter
MAKSLGSPLLVIVVWLAMGLMALSGAFCYGELAARYPRTGGGYVYLREAYGPRLGFLYGWKCFLVMDPGLTAALAVGMASYVGYIVHLSPAGTKVVAIGAVAAIAAANILGVSLGARLLRSLAVLKIVSLGFIIHGASWTVWGLGQPVAARSSAAWFSAAVDRGCRCDARGFLFVRWVVGLEQNGRRSRDPQRTLPRAIAFGVCIVTLLYVATSVAFYVSGPT